MAGSALAAVVAAMLAGRLGVYGTVLGAGVVSVVATTGGTVFQHLFKRTGEQIRDAATPSEPRLRQVPVRDASRAVGRARSADLERTQLLGRIDAADPPPGTEDRTQLLHQVSHPGANPAQSEAYAGAYTGAHDDAYIHASSGEFSEEFSKGTTHGTRLRGRKRPLLAAAAVFALAMGTVTAVELVSGSSADGDKGGTTVSRIFQPDRSEKKQDEDQAPPQTPDPGRSHDGNGTDAGDSGSTPSPGASQQGGGTGGKNTPTPTPTPSSGGGTPKPTPTPDSGTSPDAGKGGTGGQGSGGTGGQSPSPQPGQNAAAGTSTGTTGTGTVS
ncbi:hypothetical protein [Streptomyces abikoensis]|uniref:hypothetical protein n=1 Tax=Streptomyces abikoensis TaxID=97398 RepID=UPI001679F89E|nr:hypothetical protein [Streptomyces abikoensis]GGP41311.1 hypothetical protein GCM10010214_13400 [Streptomyces abikoensis]